MLNLLVCQLARQSLGDAGVEADKVRMGQSVSIALLPNVNSCQHATKQQLFHDCWSIEPASNLLCVGLHATDVVRICFVDLRHQFLQGDSEITRDRFHAPAARQTGLSNKLAKLGQERKVGGAQNIGKIKRKLLNVLLK